MKLTGNTILITGGGSGIGLALGEALQKEGNEVLVAGRSPAKLETAKQRGLRTFTVDMSDPKSIQLLADQTSREFPKLNWVIHNAGIMRNENILRAADPKTAIETIHTNLLGPILLTEALLPHLVKQPAAVIMTVTSGLAFAPLAMTPSYSATKAAIHSFSQSLRYQLKDSSVRVIELVPPYVQTELMGERQGKDPMAMPLADFIREVMEILKSQPNLSEILVQRVHAQRFSASPGEEKYAEFFNQLNDRLFAARKSEW